MAKASVREISRITGFSPATVSNALNRKRSVSEETAKVILECAQSLGYQQSTQLESIQFVLARKTGAILDESTFHPAVIEGVERQARRHGCPQRLGPLRRCGVLFQSIQNLGQVYAFPTGDQGDRQS